MRRLRFKRRGIDRRGPVSEFLPEVLQQVGLVVPGDLAVGRVRERGEVVMASQDHRERGLDRVGVDARRMDRRPAPEQRPGGEVLDLALAVDRRVGDHGDGLLEVVGEVLALRRQGRQRPVVAERADRLGAV